MKKFLMLASVLLLSVSCVELNGRLSVHESLTVKKKSGFLNLKTSKIELQPGTYTASLNVKSDRNIDLELEGNGLDKKIKIPVISEDDLKIPADGKFAIAGEKINQPFDVVGQMNTDVTYSDVRYAIETCTWTTRENRCEKVCTGDRETRKCDVVCREVTITHEGRHDVEFQYRYTRRDVSLELMQEGSTALKAGMFATSTETDRITLREGICRAHW